jgi:hypothetical protein
MNSKLTSKIEAMKNKNIIIYNISKDSHLSDIFLLPKIALDKVKELRNQGNDVLFIFDNAEDFFMSEKITYSNANIYHISNMFSSIYDECGNFTKGSLTSLIVSNIVNKFIEL